MSRASPTPISARGNGNPSAAAQSDKWALLALAALFVLMLAASWQRWTQPLIDHGREMNLPTRILAGEQLYADVQFLYGPFAPYFNALLYQIFGIHLATLHASGIVCAALILWLIYSLARQLAGAWEAMLTAGLVLVICALKFTANYVSPYTYAALYGLVFALGSLVCTVRYLQCQGSYWFGWAGICAGLALISKPEIAAAALAAAAVALVLSSIAAHKLLWRDAFFFALPVIAITLATYAFILSHVPWRKLLEDNYVLFTHVPPQLIYYNRHISGLAQWPKSFWLAASGVGVLTVLSGMCALLGAFTSWRREPEWRKVARRALAVAALGLTWWLLIVNVFGVRSDASPLVAAPFVLLIIIGGISWRVWRTKSERTRISPQNILLLLAVFSLVLILRVILNVTISGPYSPFFVAPLILIYLYLLFQALPAYLVPAGALRANTQRAAIGFIALAIIAVGTTSALRYRRLNNYEVGAQRGSFFTRPSLGRPLAEAIRFVRERTSPDDYVLTLPEATSINFLSERRYPLRQEIIPPGFLEGEKEEEAIHRLEARRVPLILVANLPMLEFRDRVFGEDYNQKLMRWIREHYHLTARFDSEHSRNAQLGDEPFFILAYERNP